MFYKMLNSIKHKTHESNTVLELIIWLVISRKKWEWKEEMEKVGRKIASAILLYILMFCQKPDILKIFV